MGVIAFSQNRGFCYKICLNYWHYMKFCCNKKDYVKSFSNIPFYILGIYVYNAFISRGQEE